ncbi:MAG: ABC transporter substrate-binding protein [Dehalococcoidia bacterium]
MTHPTGSHSQGVARFRTTRRGFFRGAAVTSAGLMGAALIGCTSGSGTSTPTTAPATGTPSGAGTGTASPTGTSAPLGTVNVLGVWGAEELTAFQAMVKPWEDQNGGKVNFTGTRDLTATLTARVEGNNAPNIAIPAEIGLFQQFAKDKKLVSLKDLGMAEDVTSNYPKAFTDLGSVDGTLYGYFMKADTKATIWYSPKVFQEHGWKPLTADSSFADLEALTKQITDAGMAPWSIGLESEGASGWPGTDWIQQIVLNEAGPDTYDGLISGSTPLTDAKFKSAWEVFGRMANMTAQGSPDAINATNFKDSTYLPFQDPPKAAMVFLGGFAGGFISDQFPNLKAGEGYDFFPWPGGGVTGGANIVYAFDDKPATASLMKYLASANAQEIWAQRGGFTSLNKQVSLDSYPNPVARKQAQQLTEASQFRFDLDDAIGGAVQQAYFTGVTQYVADPQRLDTILSSLQNVRKP